MATWAQTLLVGGLLAIGLGTAHAGDGSPVAVAGVYDPAWEVSDGSPFNGFCRAKTDRMKESLGVRDTICRCARAAKVDTASSRLGGDGEVALLQVMCDSPNGVRNEVALVLRTASGWVLGPSVLTTGTTEARDSIAHGRIDRFAMKTTAQGPVLLVDTQETTVQVDFAANVRTSRESTTRWVCRTPGTEPACFKLPVAGLTALEVLDEDVRMPRGSKVVFGTTTWERDVKVDVHGSVNVSAPRGTPPATLDKLKGPYAISALHRKGDVLSMWKP